MSGTPCCNRSVMVATRKECKESRVGRPASRSGRVTIRQTSLPEDDVQMRRPLLR